MEIKLFPIGDWGIDKCPLALSKYILQLQSADNQDAGNSEKKVLFCSVLFRMSQCAGKKPQLASKCKTHWAEIYSW